ncbi:hypothetical protein HDU87_008073 [Geranomyces variabilis]|uniref:Uncharacterized protein n=1 Tax=Geranomyces variabilis TaxID=109894 RepID=A0AAD5XPQ4_9FUNG|nr:hypothetical protein HDU87_008073 [Geranomyces variabilis]
MTTEFINALRIYRRPPTASELLHENIERSPLLVSARSEVALIDSGGADLAVVRKATLYEHVSGFAQHAPGSLSPKQYRSRSPVAKKGANVERGKRAPADGEGVEMNNSLRFRRPDLPSLESLCIASINTSELEPCPPPRLRLRPQTAPAAQRRIHSAPSRAPSGVAVSTLLRRRPILGTATRQISARAPHRFSVEGSRPLSAISAEGAGEKTASAVDATAAPQVPSDLGQPPSNCSTRAPAARPTRPVTAQVSVHPSRTKSGRARSAKPVVRDDEDFDPPLSDILFVGGSTRRARADDTQDNRAASES